MALTTQINACSRIHFLLVWGFSYKNASLKYESIFLKTWTLINHHMLPANYSFCPLLSLQRKKCLLLNNIFLMTGALLAVTSRAAKSFEMIIISRVLVGINAGMSFHLCQQIPVFKLLCCKSFSLIDCAVAMQSPDWNEQLRRFNK